MASWSAEEVNNPLLADARNEGEKRSRDGLPVELMLRAVAAKYQADNARTPTSRLPLQSNQDEGLAGK